MIQFVGKRLANKGIADYDETLDFNQDGNVYMDDDDDEPDEEEQSILAGIDDQTEEMEEEEAERIAVALDEVANVSPEDQKLGKSAVVKVRSLASPSYSFTKSD